MGGGAGEAGVCDFGGPRAEEASLYKIAATCRIIEPLGLRSTESGIVQSFGLRGTENVCACGTPCRPNHAVRYDTIVDSSHHNYPPAAQPMPAARLRRRQRCNSDSDSDSDRYRYRYRYRYR